MIDPADSDQLFDLMRRHRIQLKHRLGQNFLIDPGARDAVAEAAGITPEDDVTEVGAGVGTLTIALARHARTVRAVELDRTLIPALREVVSPLANVEVINADILAYDASIAGQVIAGNIPYSLTGALIEKLLQPEPRPKRLSLVVQKEVAERWTASTSASLSTVAVQVFATARIAMTIPASAFTPPPRVDSALVLLEVRERPAVNVDDMNAFLRFVEAAFQFRRKQLGGALGRISGRGSTEAAARLRDTGIDPQRRPQTLTLAEWEAIFRSFAASGR
ncbi:MAG TPA: 16S rRNA (adenine(1518)-N(6)/adenine(1519)-N(6))-dimethyltransferase RsmA [Candidatus Dormibacteraeota bacterium]|nr:16S rRNA (adenine(1518)-N(6)/adenine(1519)-N(6))-dimethyltransferase RsmA [Candidatus Dormibacteraeota bacterium]